MYCYKCGNKIPDESDYCPYCGKPLPDLDTKVGQSKAKPRHNNTNKWWLIVFSVIMIVLLSGYTVRRFLPDLLKAYKPADPSPEPSSVTEGLASEASASEEKTEYEIKGYWKTDKSIDFYLVIEENEYTTTLPGISVRSHASEISSPEAMQLLNAAIENKGHDPDGIIKPVVKKPGISENSISPSGTDAEGFSREEIIYGVLSYHFVSEDTITVKITKTGSIFTLYRGKLGI